MSVAHTASHLPSWARFGKLLPSSCEHPIRNSVHTARPLAMFLYPDLSRRDTVNLAFGYSPLRATLTGATSFGAPEVLGPTVGRIRNTTIKRRPLRYQPSAYPIFISLW